MSCRLDGFDYTKPYFYMVTLKKRPGLPPFSALAPGGARIGWIPQERNEVVSRLMDAGKLLYAKVQSKAWNPGGTWLMIDISLYMRDT